MPEQKSQVIQAAEHSSPSDMVAEKAKQIFELAESKTKSSQLEWRGDESDETLTAYTASGFVLKFFPWTSFVDDERLGPPSLTLYDNSENLIFDITKDVVGSERLTSLYNLVKHSAEGTEEKLQLIIQDLTAL